MYALSQSNIAAAIQLAKDYSNAQVYPVHLAFVLLNDGTGDVTSASAKPQGQSLFYSVIQKAGGEPVS